jgi:hypothetical protein
LDGTSDENSSYVCFDGGVDRVDCSRSMWILPEALILMFLGPMKNIGMKIRISATWMLCKSVRALISGLSDISNYNRSIVFVSLQYAWPSIRLLSE